MTWMSWGRSELDESLPGGDKASVARCGFTAYNELRRWCFDFIRWERLSSSTSFMRILDFIKPKDLSRVAKLQMLAREIVEGYCSGRHRSPHKGFSVEFKEHRQYVHGDELKNIDWKVYGKSDRLFIRQYEEETNLRCTLLVDQSGSMAYAGARSYEGLSKHDYATRLSAAMAYLMLGQQDPVGLITFDNDLRKQVPLRSRASHLQPILQALSADQSRRETDLGRGVSQNRSQNRSTKSGCNRVRLHGRCRIHREVHWRNSVRASTKCYSFRSWTPMKWSFPSRGESSFMTLESVVAEQTVDASTIRQAYQQRLDQHNSDLRDACRRSRVDLIQTTTDRPFADVLHEYVSARRRVKR